MEEPWIQRGWRTNSKLHADFQLWGLGGEGWHPYYPCCSRSTVTEFCTLRPLPSFCWSDLPVISSLTTSQDSLFDATEHDRSSPFSSCDRIPTQLEQFEVSAPQTELLNFFFPYMPQHRGWSRHHLAAQARNLRFILSSSLLCTLKLNPSPCH